MPAPNYEDGSGMGDPGLMVKPSEKVLNITKSFFCAKRLMDAKIHCNVSKKPLFLRQRSCFSSKTGVKNKSEINKEDRCAVSEALSYGHAV